MFVYRRYQKYFGAAVYIFERSNSNLLQNIGMPCLYWCIAKTTLCAFWACQVYSQVRWLYERYTVVRNIYRLLIKRLALASLKISKAYQDDLISTLFHKPNYTTMFQPIQHKLIWIASLCSWLSTTTLPACRFSPWAVCGSIWIKLIGVSLRSRSASDDSPTRDVKQCLNCYWARYYRFE
jgi:hypothetical protein